MSEDIRKFVPSNKDKEIFEFRSENNHHLAPNVTLISSDNVKIKGHSIILGTCHYFRKLFKNDKTTISHLVFNEDFAGDVLEFVVKYIYTGEFSLLDVEKLSDVIRATSKEKYNMPALAKGYLLKQLEAPEGINQINWHLFYKNGIKLSLEESVGYLNRIYAFLKEKYPEFYKSREFGGLTYEEICKIMKSPNRPFVSNTTLMEATLIWTTENKAGMDKLAELSKMCINLFQNGNHNPQIEDLPMIDASIPVQSDNGLLSIPTCPQHSTHLGSDSHCSTSRKRTRSISPQIWNSETIIPTLQSLAQSVSDSRSDTHPQSVPNLTSSVSTPTGMTTRANSRKNGTLNLNKRSLVELYHPPKYSWGTTQLLFFGKAESEPGYLWSYIFNTGEIKKMARLPIEALEGMSLVSAQYRIYSIGGRVWYKPQDLVRSFAISDLENIDKDWDEGPKFNRARFFASTLLFRNTIYLFPGNGSHYSSFEKWDISGKPGAWEDNEKHMLHYRTDFGVALLDNIIYMIGGCGFKRSDMDLNQALDTAESYNIDDKTQSVLPNLNQARFELRAVALKDRIYAIGGLNDGYTKLESVESYKPGNLSWKQVASMNYPRAFGSAFVLDLLGWRK